MFKKLLFLLVLSFTLFGCGSSRGTTEQSAVVAIIELTADKTAITADGIETVNLSVIVKDKDNVIINGADISFYEGITKLSDNKFTTTTAGAYNITAKSGNVTSNIIIVTAKDRIIPTTIELTADKTSIIADGLAVVTLSATVKDKDNAIINGANVLYYEGSRMLSDNKFKTTTAGTYNITARMENIISNAIIINANKKMTTEQDFKTSVNVNNTCEISDYTSVNKEVSIPEKINGIPVTTIGKDVFYKSDLINVSIPNSVVNICNGAFYSNKLTSITIPNEVTNIGEYAFNKNELTSVIIPNSVVSIGEYAFSDNELTSVTMSNGITTISESLFSWNKLTSIIIPNGVKSIGKSAFSNNKLISATIPDSVTSIEENAFTNNELASITIPNGIITINESVFTNSELTSVTIPNSVTSIGENAFYLNQLTSVTIPSSVTTIGTGAFAGNTNLTIHGKAGSTAETYAKNNKISFIAE